MNSDVAHRHVGAIEFDSDYAARLHEESVRRWKLLLAIGMLCTLSAPMPFSSRSSRRSRSPCSWAGPSWSRASCSSRTQWAANSHGCGSSGWRLLISVLTIVAGAFILIAPLTGTITLTVVLVAWLWAVGVTRLMAWWMTRRAERSWLTAVNGALSIALGVLIWADFPDSATWAIGLLVGIELLFAGSSLIMTALFGRRLARAAREG